MNEIRKAAVLLLSLEKPLAAEVLSQLPKRMVEQVVAEVARLEEVSQEEQAAVLDEFYAVASTHSFMERGGMDLAGDLLEQSLGREGANEILEQVKQSMSPMPFGFLQKVGTDNLLTFIVEEHPQTIALVMSHLPPAMAAEVLSGIPSNKQMEVIRRIAAMEQTSPEVIHEVESSLESRMTSTFNEQMEKAGGIPMVAQILNVTDRATNKGILRTLEQEDAELVDEIRRLMFVFDDLLKLDDRSLQTVLKEVETNQWAVSLKGASEEIKEKVFNNMSQRAREILQEEMEYLGPVRVSEVESMQQQIVDIVRRLEDAGEVQISTGTDADQFIT